MMLAAILAALPAAADVRPPRLQPAVQDGVQHKAADSGISIVRMPRRPHQTASQETPKPPPSQQPPQPPPQQGKLVKLTARVASQPNSPAQGWLGVYMEQLELPLALSLGLVNADGALITGLVAGGPAVQSGMRFGDIVVGLNGGAIASMDDLRRKVAAMAPGLDANLEVWRASDGDFLQLLRRLADDGNAHVMYRLGRIYAGGSGVAKDEAQAAQWYRKGADAGNTNAMTALAIMLLEGRGGASANVSEGLQLLRTAASRNHLDAMYRLAHVLAAGRIAEKDALEAARLFTRAAEAGHTPSMVDLAWMYSSGVGVQADPFKAASWYKQAADRGNAAGMVGLGLAYENGRGVETDPNRAAMLYKRAADLGNSAGMLHLGLLYAQGKGVGRNEAAAVDLYRKAAALNNAAAMNNLAWMLQGGRGVDRPDPDEAADFMMKSLDRRNEFSLRQMTQFHSRGWSREFRRAMQQRLRDAGFYSGRVDGNFRDTTIAAVTNYFNRAR
jgi:TPR repeat protein